MLEVDDAVVVLGGARVVDGVSLRVETGQVVVLLGPSGSGKTTVLRAVAGLQPLEGGRVVLDGRDLRDVPVHARGLGLMFQDYALFPHLDVGENVAFGLRMRGDAAGPRARRVEEVLDLVGLAGFERRAVSSLSGGERQRVALARALAPAPRLLMLDEPLGALDRALRERLLVDLQHLFARLDVGVLYVTHDQSEALALADDVVVLRDGRVARSGQPRAVWADPGDPWVARFLGFDNLFEGVARDGTVVVGWGELAVAGAPPEEGPVTVLVRGRGVTLEPGGPLTGTVEGVRFAGDATEVRVGVGDGRCLVVPVSSDELPAIGDVVGLRVAPDAVELLRSGPPGS